MSFEKMKDMMDLDIEAFRTILAEGVRRGEIEIVGYKDAEPMFKLTEKGNEVFKKLDRQFGNYTSEGEPIEQ
jgi:hypothetical protein